MKIKKKNMLKIESGSERVGFHCEGTILRVVLTPRRRQGQTAPGVG